MKIGLKQQIFHLFSPVVPIFAHDKKASRYRIFSKCYFMSMHLIWEIFVSILSIHFVEKFKIFGVKNRQSWQFELLFSDFSPSGPWSQGSRLGFRGLTGKNIDKFRFNLLPLVFRAVEASEWLYLQELRVYSANLPCLCRNSSRIADKAFSRGTASSQCYSCGRRWYSSAPASYDQSWCLSGKYLAVGCDSSPPLASGRTSLRRRKIAVFLARRLHYSQWP